MKDGANPMSDALERIEMALGAMAAGGPRNIRAYLAQPGPDVDQASPAEVDQLLDLILSPDPNATARLRFSNLLRSWDNARDEKWSDDSPRNSPRRREVIHARLKSDPDLAQRIDLLLPFFQIEEPLVIAERHQDWYAPRPGVRDYYWQSYCSYLRQRRHWEPESLIQLENTTRAIVECLANPEAREAYASRGLVMGYVQSGKTANFTGVVARAADAGYRLIIVLAGTWNILRNQTQRRFDKELLGKELLKNDSSYHPPPPDWDEFQERGQNPVDLGHYTWQRLTRPDIDFRSLKSAIDNLEFDRANKAAALYDPSNLHALPVKLLVVKKHGGILHKLAQDLKLLQTRLRDLPTLVIDDESDQAGVNTVDPKKAPQGSKARSTVNKRIVELLALFPRGQYVGYTATPYANALIDPDDEADLFPKDFIVSLERPLGYMGVSDFFDPNVAFVDLKPNDVSQPEIAYIRRVENPADSDDEDLKRALRSYVLAGALKLFRCASAQNRYAGNYARHHTMLVHTSPSTGEQASTASRIEALWNQCAFNSPQGARELEALWTTDHAPVSRAHGSNEVNPESFSELVPFVADVIQRIERGQRVLIVVNYDSKQAPDFNEAPVWKIVVGGNKLSRGYTVEGLTVSYYRRVAATGDTLMQMGRWFGFRSGYKDLVRVFLGVQEGKQKADLVSHFKDVCRMEERFRQELVRYVRRPGAERITPKQIPPLIAISGNLLPTARNKMFNAAVAKKNFGGTRSMPTLLPKKEKAMKRNLEVLEQTIQASRPLGTRRLGGTLSGEQRSEFPAKVFLSSNSEIIRFLYDLHWIESDYRYPERPADITLQVEFLEQQKHGIADWLVMAPQRATSFGPSLTTGRLGDLHVKERSRDSGRGFQVVGEPSHRTVAEFLADLRPGREKLKANDETAVLKTPGLGVMLLYPIREQLGDEVSVGFELLFPTNSLAYDHAFTVRKKSEPDSVVVTG